MLLFLFLNVDMLISCFWLLLLLLFSVTYYAFLLAFFMFAISVRKRKTETSFESYKLERRKILLFLPLFILLLIYIFVLKRNLFSSIWKKCFSFFFLQMLLGCDSGDAMVVYFLFCLLFELLLFPIVYRNQKSSTTKD